MNASSSSLEAVLAGLSAGDQDAARRLHERYVQALIRLAARRLGRDLGPRADPESVAQSVFLSFFLRQRRGDYQLYSWPMVYGLLAHITFRKCLNRIRHHRQEKRDPGPVQPLEDWTAAARDPGPDEEAMVADLLNRALADCDDDERAMIDGVLAGESAAKVAERVGLSTRTVQRTVEEFRERLFGLLDQE